mmetsp:Transcript_94956/g.138706  ORF Transcript_94956/g.138706 Transcript_94956/m.138706 type:complete len:326 (+) Transcript_94956:19-996(+)
MRSQLALAFAFSVAHSVTCFAPGSLGVKAGALSASGGSVSRSSNLRPRNKARTHVGGRRVVCSSNVKWYGDTPYADAPESEALAFESSYTDKTGEPRGFCNWLVPRKVMVGRYPHGTPLGSKTGRSSPDESKEHVRKLVEAGVSVFVMLQQEVPAQDNDELWPPGDLVPLSDPEKAVKYPEGFSRYFQDAKTVSKELKRKDPVFEHFPIPDFGVADMGDLIGFLYDLRDRIKLDGDVIYLHCWGGRGRAGTVGACLYLMLRYKDGAAFDVETAAEEALSVVQRGYDTRLGEDGGGSKSPETEEQREFVREFASQLYAQYGLNCAL